MKERIHSPNHSHHGLLNHFKKKMYLFTSQALETGKPLQTSAWPFSFKKNRRVGIILLIRGATRVQESRLRARHLVPIIVPLSRIIGKRATKPITGQWGNPGVHCSILIP
jgi:hypothetical protein